MKNIRITLFFVLLGFSSCSYNRIGSVTMISTRNIASNVEYVELARNVEGISKMSHDDPLQEAIDNAVKSIPGGEYMTNTVIYQLKDKKIKVIGDVYGRKDLNAQHAVALNTFKNGEIVTWLDQRNRSVKAEIIKQNGDTLTIKLLHNGKEFETTFARIKKLDS